MASAASQSTTQELEQTLSKYKGIVSKLKSALQSARADAARAREEAAAAAEQQAKRGGTDTTAPLGAAFSIDAVQACQETVTVHPVCVVHVSASSSQDPPLTTPSAAHDTPQVQAGEERWVLAEARSASAPSTPLDGSAPLDTGALLTRGWVCLPQLQPYLSPGQELPSAHLPPHTTEQMQEQVRTATARLAACEEAFRRFRVQAATTARRLQEQLEMNKGVQGGGDRAQRSRAGTDASHDSAGSGTVGALPAHTSGTSAALADVKAELRLVRGELNRALAANGESSARATAAEAALEAARKQLSTAEDATEAWKLRCLDAEASLGGDGGGATPAASRSGGTTPAASGGAPASGGGGGAQLGKLQREFAKYREQALRLLKSKSEALAQLKARVAELEGGAGGGSQPGIGDMDDVLLTASGAEYLRNVLVRYMACSDDGMKRTLEATIATIMRFTPEEIASVQAAQGARGSAMGVAGSVLGSIGSVFSGFGGGAAAPAPPPAPAPAPAAMPETGGAQEAGAPPLGGSSIMSALAQHEIR